MMSFATLGQILTLALIGFAVVYWLLGRFVPAKRAQHVPVTQAEPAAGIVEVLERIAALEISNKTLVRQLTDLDDSVEHRFRRLNARAKREPEAEPLAADDDRQVSLPFGSANTGGFPTPPANGRRPFGRGTFGPTR